MCKFRHLLHTTWPSAASYSGSTRILSENGLSQYWHDFATIIDAPTSTKNKDGKRDPEMHQTKKGNEWYFGMKGHIGEVLDQSDQVIHSVPPCTAVQTWTHDSQLLVSGSVAGVKPGSVGYDHGLLRLIAMSLQNTRRVPKTLPTRTKAQSSVEAPRTASQNRTKSKVRAKGEQSFPDSQANFWLLPGSS